MSTLPRIRNVALAAVLTLASTGLLTAATIGPASAAVIVRGSGASWLPATTNIARGGAVRWRATSGNHVVKAYGGNWFYRQSLPQGTTTAPRTFNSRGRFRFFCTIHGSVTNGVCSGMCGKIVVG